MYNIASPSPSLDMVQSPARPLTLEAFLKLPETKPASEFINGQISQKPMPQGKHSTIQLELGTLINQALKSHQIARAYTELRCTVGDRSTIPDIAVFTWNRIPRDDSGKVANLFLIAPDWTIEILSPDQGQSKVVRNILHCLNQGTQMGWLIDPEEELIFVYLADQTIAVFEGQNQLIPVPTFASSLQLTVGQIFSCLKD